MQGQTELSVITKAKDLCSYIMTVTQRSPKHFGDVDEFETLLSDWLDETISYYDSKENYYHGFLSGLIVGFKGYDVKSNRESSDGRPDLLILERKRHKLAVVLEIKVAERFRDLDAKCDEALRQIEENRYEAELKYDCFQKILKYGVAFCDKACRVKLEEE